MRADLYTAASGGQLQFYQFGAKGPALVLIHAQGTSSESFFSTAEKLSNEMHVYLVDCYGHGKSTHDPARYHLPDLGQDISEWIRNTIDGPVTIGGHSSGGLIASYLAAHLSECRSLILEDPPMFSSWEEKRTRTFNYVDLSTVCHNFLLQTEETDFVLYYFKNQYAWNLFPEKSREKTKSKLISRAENYRVRHPGENLKVRFWPSEVFCGMNEYDPNFGDTFYHNTFHGGVDYPSILKQISCPTLFLKANTVVGENGLLQCALSEEDLDRVCTLISDCRVERFNSGHGIHTEREKEFVKMVRAFVRRTQPEAE